MPSGFGRRSSTVSTNSRGRHPASARRIAEAHRAWGKGAHPASLNFGDCFAYEVAREHGCRLLFVGDDFVRTDIENAL
ncbi:twitching motility protein PilT [Rhizobium leguminosarum bv. trifolii WSM1689]|nr:twitching motility protein PilT [Rhizobium leguminosarum bv. trifolii WSM1689]